MFQHLMDNSHQGYAAAYINSVIIFLHSWPQHLKDLKALLQELILHINWKDSKMNVSILAQANITIIEAMFSMAPASLDKTHPMDA